MPLSTGAERASGRERPDFAAGRDYAVIHRSRYGMPQAHDESFLIFFLSQDRKHILHTDWLVP